MNSPIGLVEWPTVRLSVAEAWMSVAQRAGNRHGLKRKGQFRRHFSGVDFEEPQPAVGDVLCLVRGDRPAAWSLQGATH